MDHPVDLFVSDQYQFTTSYTYFISNKHEQVATFQIFFRKHPFKGQFALCAGINAVKQFYKNLSITEEQIQFLKNKFPHMREDYFEWLKKNVKYENIKVKSFKQGEVVFAKEPIITYTGPLSLVQLLQTPTLNLIGFASLVTTNAFRMVKAASFKKCAELGVRRAQGPDGGLSASQYSYLGGFMGTSNLQASLKFGIPCVGTMSHAFVTSFMSLQEAEFVCNGKDIVARAIQIRKQLGFKTHDGELASFLMYAKAFQNSLVALIDTYGTLTSGILNSIIVAKALHQVGVKEVGIRLDSGDLCSYSKSCRQMWAKYVPEIKLNILASDDLNEQRILEMQNNKSQIDIYGIGTNIATCQKQPALGLVCKLVELDNKPKMKFSETAEKATYPSKKSIYRIWAKQEEKCSFDLITLQNQELPDKIVAVDNANHLIKYEVNIKKKLLLNQYWNLQNKLPTIEEDKVHLHQSQKQISDVTFHLTKPTKYPVLISEAYLQEFRKTVQKNIVLRTFD